MPTFSPDRSEAIRLALEDTVRLSPARSVVKRWMPGAALLVIGLVTGGAVSAAAVTTLQSGPAVEGIAAPPGVIPGEPIISLLGTTTTARVAGTSVIPLPTAPDGATHLRVSFTCLTPGQFSWGLDAGGNNTKVVCSASDIDSVSGYSWFDFPIEAQTSLYVNTGAEQEAVLSLQYVNYVPTALGVNEHGNTFGGATQGLEPDLIAVIGIDSQGEQVQGYAWARDLNAFGPEWPDLPSNPDEALRWQAERDKRYPDGWDIPVYESDGTTQIGTFHVGS